MSAAIRLELAQDFQEIPVSRSAWNAVVAKSETNTVFQTYEWFSSWLSVFRERHHPCFILAYDGAELVGIAPFASKDGTLRFASDTHADYCDVIAGHRKRDVIRAVLGMVVDKHAACDSVALNNIPESSSTVALLQELAPGVGLRSLVRGTVACPTVILDQVPGGARALLRKDSLQRPYTHFLREGTTTFRNVTDIAEACRLLPHFFEQHIDRWHGEKHRSLFNETDNQRFYEKLMRQLLPTGWLVFSVVDQGGEPVAFHYGFSYGDTFLWYKPSFDIRRQKQSPGSVMLRFLIEQAIQQGKKEFDFTVGDEPFKRRYSNAVRYNTNVMLTSRVRRYATARVWVAIKRLVRLVLGDHA